MNQKFDQRYSSNFIVHIEYLTDIPKLVLIDNEIELVDERTFYPYSEGTCRGDDIKIYVFKMLKKGAFQIEFSSETVKVIVN